MRCWELYCCRMCCNSAHAMGGITVQPARQTGNFCLTALAKLWFCDKLLVDNCPHSNHLVTLVNISKQTLIPLQILLLFLCRGQFEGQCWKKEFHGFAIVKSGVKPVRNKSVPMFLLLITSENWHLIRRIWSSNSRHHSLISINACLYILSGWWKCLS